MIESHMYWSAHKPYVPHFHILHIKIILILILNEGFAVVFRMFYNLVLSCWQKLEHLTYKYISTDWKVLRCKYISSMNTSSGKLYKMKLKLGENIWQKMISCLLIYRFESIDI